MFLKLFEYTDTISEEWDKFVLASSLGSIHQISNWKKFQEKIPGRGEVLGFGVRDKKGKIIATTFCVRMETGFLDKFWYYSARGPVFDIKNKKALKFLLQAVNEKLKEKGGIFWRFDPYLEPSAKYPDSKEKKENLILKSATQDYQPTDTLEIDLTQTEDAILAQMKRRGRNGINKAIKKEVKIQIIENGQFSENNLKDFYDLNIETTTRDGFSGHKIDYYQNFLSSLKNSAVLFFATYEDQRIASAISTFCGDKAIYYFGASTSNRELNKLKAPTLLQWEMMKYAKKRGCKTYDFLGIAPENEPNHSYAGISQFKHGFGGYRKIYQPGKEIVLNKFWYFIYQMMKKFK